MSDSHALRGRERSMSLPAACYFNQEIAHFSKQKQYDQACQSFKRMLSSGVLPDVVTYNTMINVYVKTQRLGDAFSLYQQMQQSGIEPTIVTYTSLVDGCGKSGVFGRALNIFEEVKAKKIPMNMHFFNALLNAAFLNGSYTYVGEIRKAIKESRQQPNSVTYNTLISGYAKYKQIKHIFQLCKEMLKDKIEVSPATQSTLISISHLITSIDEIPTFLQIIKDFCIEITPTILQRFVNDIASTHRLQILHEFFKRCIILKLPLDSKCFTTFVRLAGEFANFTIISWIQTNASELSIDIGNEIIYAQLTAFAKFGNTAKVYEIYTKIRSSSYSIPSVTRLAVIQNLLNSGDYKMACDIAKELLKGNCQSTDVDKLIQSFFDRNLFEPLLQLYSQISTRMFKISQRTADCIIGASVNTIFNIDILSQLTPSAHGIIQLVNSIKDEDKSRVPWTHMIESVNPPPQSAILFELMNALQLRGLSSVAWATFKRNISLGVLPSENSIELALQTQSDLRSHENLIFILNATRSAKILPSTELWTAVITSALKIGNLAEALSLKEEADTQHTVFPADLIKTFQQSMEGLKHALPNPSVITHVSRSRGRLRSNTLPVPVQQRPSNQFSAMEEISNRAAIWVLGNN